MNMGWKTILGAVCYAAGCVADGFGFPEIGAGLKAIGSFFGFVGLRHAVAKIGK